MPPERTITTEYFSTVRITYSPPNAPARKQITVVSSNSFTMRVFANDSDRVTIGQASPAGFATPNFQYPGFLQPCNSIDHVTYQLNVTSSGQPLPIG